MIRLYFTQTQPLITGKKIINSLKSFYLFLVKEKILRLLGVIAMLVLFCSIGISYFEEISFQNSLWWSFVTLTTVGYGDIAPATWGGRIIGILMMFFGIGVLGLFTATMATIFVDNKFKKERGWVRAMVKDHILICGWNFRAAEIINEIRCNIEDERSSIVLLADLAKKPIEDEDVHFVQGVVTEENLKKTNVKEAKSVIILVDDKLDEYSRDAKAILNTLTVKSMAPEVYTCIELTSTVNIAHGKRAKADEIIVGEQYSVKLLTQAAVNHGITLVISEILSRQYGNDLYKIPVPESIVGKTFLESLLTLKKEHDYLIVAVQSLSNDVFMTNPPSDYMIRKDDQIILISKEKVDG